MVKLASKGSQDPTDASLQMKVKKILIFRSDNSLLWEENSQPNKIPAQKSMLWDCSQETTLLPNLNSGITWEDYSKLKALKDKSFQLMKSMKEDQVTLKPSESF